MQVSSLNEVKIYSLSAGRSLPEVSAAGRGAASEPGEPGGSFRPRGAGIATAGPSVSAPVPGTAAAPRGGAPRQRLPTLSIPGPICKY